MALPIRTKAAAAESLRRARISLLIGLGVTLAVVIADTLGALTRLEAAMLDWRARLFARFTPPPSDRIVHIDIDDNSLSTIGRWPWNRIKLARVVDELRRARAAVVAFDLLFDESQEPRLVAPTDPKDKPVLLNDDAELASAIRQAGNVLLPVNMSLGKDLDPLLQQAREALENNPELPTDQLIQKLRLSTSQQQFLSDKHAALRASVFRQKIAEMFEAAAPTEPTFKQIRAEVLPGLPEYVTEAPQLKTLQFEYDCVISIRALARKLPNIDMSRFRFGKGANLTVPVPLLSEAAATTGFVTFQPEPDGVVRSIPLWLAESKSRYPQFSLAAACLLLKVPMDKLQVTEDYTLLPGAVMPDGSTRDIRLPTLGRRLGESATDMRGRMLISWPSNSPQWMFLFNPGGSSTRQHLPIGLLVELNQIRDEWNFARRNAHIALANIGQDPQAGKTLKDQTESLSVIFESLEMGEAGAEEKYDKLREEIVSSLDFNIDLNDPAAKAAPIGLLFTKYKDNLKQIDQATRKIAEAERRLHPQLGGAVCIVGWTGTGAIADFVTTSLETRVPGPVVHGAVLNAILTNHFIRRVPQSLDLLIVLAIGLLSILFAARFGPVTALLMTALLAAGYFAINGAFFFDYLNHWVEAAGPIVAAVGAWGGVTVHRLVAEQRDRARITRQFKNYVAPDLVDYLVDNPQLIKLEGAKRTMTCVFTDIAGFTKVADQLGPERTVSLLNKYLSVATDKLMEFRGTVNKYLGDGILAFWNAPIENANHALDACLSVLSCIKAFDEVRGDPDQAEMPILRMRAGIATGDMMVGDFGAPPRRSDYTIIGDTVNLASRLESSNKQFGTQVLISSGTYEVVKYKMLCRPIGRIVVVGRRNAEPVYELLGPIDTATPEQHKLAAETAAAVQAYITGDFPKAIELFLNMAQDPAQNQLANRYLESCERHLRDGTDPTQFDGALILTEK